MKRYHTYKDSGVEWIGEVPTPTTNSDYFLYGLVGFNFLDV